MKKGRKQMRKKSMTFGVKCRYCGTVDTIYSPNGNLHCNGCESLLYDGRSGCLPDKEDRLQAFKTAKEKIKKAFDCLDSVDDPDDNPDLLGEAVEYVHDSLGKRQGAFIDHDYEFGLTDLCKHYF